MSAVQLHDELNDSTISTSQNHEGTKKHKKHKHKVPVDNHPADVSLNTSLAVDGMPSAEKKKLKKKKRDRSSENNDSIIEPSQSDTVNSKSKQHKSKSREKLLKDAENEMKEDQEPESVTTTEEKKKKKKKKRDMASDTVAEPSQSHVVENRRKRHKSQIEEVQLKDPEIEPEQVSALDAVAKPSQSNVVENRRKRHKSQSQIEEVQSKDPEIEPEQDQDSTTELSQQSRRKRRKTNQLEEVQKETEKVPEQDSKFNGVEKEDKKILRSSNRIVAESQEMNKQDRQILFSRMLSSLPKYDGISYLQRLEEFDWNDIKFGNFSVENCQKQFNRIVTKVRKSRTLAELIRDAQASQKCLDGAGSSKKWTPKPLAKHTGCQLYLKRKVDAYLQKHPGIKRDEVAEKYRSKWAALSDEEKVKYIRKAEDRNIRFQEQVEEKCCKNPSYRPPRTVARLSKVDQKILDRVDGIPPKPPGSGYLMFCEILTERLRTEIPDISAIDVLIEIGHRWSALSEEKKEHYKRKSDKKKHKYLKFLEAHPEIEAKVNADKRTKIIVRKTRRRIFEGEPAKPPSSGYMLFCKEVLPTLTDFPGSQRMQEASKRWAALPEENKVEYIKKIKTEMKIYLDELKTFKKKLSAEDLQRFEEIHKPASPVKHKKSLPGPSKVIAEQKNPTPGANGKAVRKRKKTASKKAKEKSPIPHRKSNGGADDDKGNVSDASSEVF